MVSMKESIVIGKSAWPRTWAVIAVFLILSSPTLLTEKGSWNVTSRWALTRAIVERGTFAIDGLEWATGDRSFKEGHYYSDKAPGLSFLGAAVLAPVRLIEKLVGNFGFSAEFFLVRMATVTLPTWVLMAMGFIWLRKRGFPDFEAGLGMMIWYAATPAMVYSHLFFGHQAAAWLLLASFFILELGENRWWSYVLSGGIAGWALITEYPTAIIVGALFIGYPFPKAKDRIRFLVGMLPPLFLLGVYNTVCFGAPWRLGYGFETVSLFSEGMAEGFYGITLPSLRSLYIILLSPRRGLLFLCPFLVLPLFGRRLIPRRLNRRNIPWLVVLGYVLMNGSYYQPDGGTCFGPRHLVPLLPILVWGVIDWGRRYPRYRFILDGLIVGSSVHLALFASTNALIPAEIRYPMTEYSLPLLRAGLFTNWWGEALGLGSLPLVTLLVPAVGLVLPLVIERGKRLIPSLIVAVALLALVIIPGFLTRPGLSKDNAFQLAFTLNASGETPKALSLLSPYLKGPLDAAYAGLALQLLAYSDLEAAVEIADEVDIDKLDEEGRGYCAFWAGSVYYRAGDLHRAELFLQKAYELGYQIPELFLTMALLYEKEGNPERALEISIEGLNAFPYNASLCRRVGRLLAEAGRSDEALPFLEKSLELDPTFSGNDQVRSIIRFLQKEIS